MLFTYGRRGIKKWASYSAGRLNPAFRATAITPVRSIKIMRIHLSTNIKTTLILANDYMIYANISRGLLLFGFNGTVPGKIYYKVVSGVPPHAGPVHPHGGHTSLFTYNDYSMSQFFIKTTYYSPHAIWNFNQLHNDHKITIKQT